MFFIILYCTFIIQQTAHLFIEVWCGAASLLDMTLNLTFYSKGASSSLCARNATHVSGGGNLSLSEFECVSFHVLQYQGYKLVL